MEPIVREGRVRCMRAAAGALLLALGIGPAEAAPPAEEPCFRAYEFVPPENAGFVDVKKRYGVAGDGVTDDTAALNKAISEHLDYHSMMLYLPAGTYLVSDTLVSKLPNGTPTFGAQLVGQSREKTIIRLKDDCPGFQDPRSPKAVAKLCSRNQLDGGNMGHKNFVHNLTIDTGKGNPGAIALDYLASNTGAVRDVLIRSGDGSGVCGIDMSKPWPGPCLITNVKIVGFDYGILLRHPEYSVTFEHIRLERQRLAGIKNDGNVLSVRNLRSTNACPAIVSRGILVLLDSDLRGAEGSKQAIEGGGLVYLRNVKASGYASVWGSLGGYVAEYCSRGVKSAFPTPERSLCLPIEDTPSVPYDPPEDSIVCTGPNIQAAIDSGKRTVYIPFREIRVDKTIIIRGNVRRIHGANSNIWPSPRLGDAPVWRYEGTSSPVVVMEWMDSQYVEHASRNTLVIRDCTGLAPRNTPGCGELFVENNCSEPWLLEHQQRIWARSLNLEHAEFDVKNFGAWLWVLGFKSERVGIQFETRKGGYTEVLGGLVYPCAAVPADRPMIINDESGTSFILRQTSYVKDGIHKIKVLDTRDGVTKEVMEVGETLYTSFKVPPELAAKGERGRKEAKATMEMPKPAGPPPRPEVKDAAALELWDSRLRQAAAKALKEGRRPRFFLSSQRLQVSLRSVSEDSSLGVAAEALEFKVDWPKLSLADKKSLALAVRPDDISGRCLAAFYLFACGEEEAAERMLEGVDAASAKELRGSFRPVP